MSNTSDKTGRKYANLRIISPMRLINILIRQTYMLTLAKADLETKTLLKFCLCYPEKLIQVTKELEV